MFVVTKRFGRSEVRLDDFIKQADAERFIQEKLAEDLRFKVKATYGLYEGADLLREFSASDLIDEGSASSGSSSDGGSGQGAGSRSSFSPTPFNTAPRPSGMPHHWVKDDEDKEKDK